ncbi:MAG: hypothetical protein H0U67_00305 [Gemmatimonadetes bacterium]|nr:hypothetical protein [Gemmatimonadota bacterium]
MPVLLEAVSVIVRRASIERVFPGGLADFVALVPNETLCVDDDLARVGFMDPDDAAEFIDVLEECGLRCLDDDGRAQDIAVGDQVKGLTTPCDWAEWYRVDHFKSGMKIAACRLKGSASWDVALPAGWDYERSLSKRFIYVAEGAENPMVPLEHGGRVEAYLDTTTGREVFMGRVPSEGGERA